VRSALSGAVSGAVSDRSLCKLVTAFPQPRGSTTGQQTSWHLAVVIPQCTVAEQRPVRGFPDRDELSDTRRAHLLIPWS
jgi:hypothetical protein